MSQYIITMKKIIAVFLFVLLSAPALAFAAGEIRFLAFDNAAGAVLDGTAVNNKIMFVKDYCAIVAQIAVNIESSAAAIFSSTVSKEVFTDARAAASFLYSDASFSGFYKKVFHSFAKPAFLFSEHTLFSFLFFVFTFIVSSMLLYIGLLRVFNSSLLNKNTIKTGLAF